MKKQLLKLTLCFGISVLAFNAQADTNFSKKLENIRNNQGSVQERLGKVYDLVEAEYQSIDGNLSAEMAGLRTAAIAKAATVAREIYDSGDTSDENNKAKLKEVEDHVQFVRCYSKDLDNYTKLTTALQNDNKAAAQAMLGESVMCINVSGVAKVKGMSGTTVLLETVVGKTPATYEWGEELNKGTHVIFGANDQKPVSLGV